MSSLMELPEEILIIITKKLDIKSAHNLYQTCQTMKNILGLKGVIKVCNLTINTLATVKSLKLGFVKNISAHLHELDMSGVCDLTKTLLLPAVKRMKCLKTLNVAYTNIILIDILDLQMSCPTIKNITINCVLKSSKMMTSTLHALQEVFKNFVNVHFVLKTLLTNLPFHVLEKSSLDTVTYTVCGWNTILFKTEEIETKFQFNHFCVFMLNWELAKIYHGHWNYLLPLVKFGNTEFIIIESFENIYSVCKTPVFTNLFHDFKGTSFVTLDLHKKMQGDVAIFIWNKETTIFDELFFCNLKKRLKCIFTCEITTTGEPPLPSGVDKHLHEWFHANPVCDERSHSPESYFKKRRVTPSSQVLDFDAIFSEHESVKLSVSFTIPGIVTLSPCSVYLRKLTYLTLTGSLIRYSNEFFNVLFRCCEKLETLNVEASALSPCCSPIMRSIPLSQSLKNIRLTDKRIDFKMLFSSFSQCKTLENINIIDRSTEFNDLADPTVLYGRCHNIYNLFICAAIKASTKKKWYSITDTLYKSDYYNSNHHMNFTLNNCDDRNFPYNPLECLPYDPYVHVFNLKPIKPV